MEAIKPNGEWGQSSLLTHGNRASTQYPDTYTFNYTYTGRNQLQTVTNFASYWYDKDGNLIQRNPGNGTTSAYSYDDLDRVTQIVHNFNPNGTTRTFNYGYYPNSNDRKWTQRLGTAQGNIGDVFDYDLADQATAVQLNVAHPESTPVGNQTIIYDPNGNCQWFALPGTNKHYDPINNLGQYVSRTMGGNTTNVTYDSKGNMTIGFDASTYQYDAQSRLTSTTKGSTTMTFTYDGLNRQVSRSVNGGTPTFSVWDGWELVQEYHMSGGNAVEDASYLHGPVKNLKTNNYYYQDGSGGTSHLANSSGVLQEWYRYDLQGKPVFYNSADQQITVSAFGVRHLFTGQQWYGDVGLYDLRNRFYSPDPSGFDGDPTNLYRYTRNNPVVRSDPTGLDVVIGSHTVPGAAFEHWYIGIDNWTLLNGGMTYFDFYPARDTDPNASWFAGRWDANNFAPANFMQSDFWQATPAQDLVILSAFQSAKENPRFYFCNCKERIYQVLNDALGPQGFKFNPVDRYTGNIYDAHWNWVGWQDPNTGNIYDAKGNWAGWDANWQQNFTSGGRGGWGGGPGGGWGGGPGFGPGSYSGPGFGLGFWSIGPQPKHPIPH